MTRLFASLAVLPLFAGSAVAQSSTLSSATSTAGVSIISPGNSIKPQALTPTGPRAVPGAKTAAPDPRTFTPDPLLSGPRSARAAKTGR